MNKKMIIIFIVMTMCIGLLSGCTVANQASQDGSTKSVKDNEITLKDKPEIIIGAAASLTEVFTEMGEVFEKENKCKVTLSFASTGNLTEQIINGAPFDVFAAANVKAVEDLDDKGNMISDTKKVYAVGRIGLATKIDSNIEVTTLEHLLNPEVKKIAIANPKAAPYGQAAKEALESSDLWEKVEDKIVYAKNIRETLNLVTSGNVEVGIIALSLYKEDEVKFTLVDDKFHNPLEQEMAVVKGTKQEKLAQSFVDFVNGEEGRIIIEKYGFAIPSDENE